MKALVLKEYNRLVYEEVPEPSIGLDDVLVQVKACGICGSDVRGMDGSTGRRIPPLIMGHEASGIITALGEDVKDFRKGDRVTFDSTISCGGCHYCHHGLINLCDHRRVLGVSCDEFRQNGAFAEYVAVPERILYPLPEGLSFERAAVVEPLAIAFHAVELTPISLNESAVVVGAGIIGLLLIELLRAAGCGKIFAVDINQHRLDVACRLGADEGIRSDRKHVPEEIYRRTGDQGAHMAFDAVGLPATVNMALESLRKGGVLTLIGNFSPTVDLPLQKTVSRQITLYGSCASSGEYPDCLEMIARGAVDIDTITSATAPLSEGPQWFGRLYKGEPGLLKVILAP
jgi:threonine dehydrogenase-like Zn-dependent dehydrogenase